MPFRELSPELQKKAEEELNEVPARIPADLKHIRDWLEKQNHLSARTDDQTLIGFLRGCKYSLQQTKDKIENYYSVRSMIPEFFENRDPFLPEIQEVLRSNIIIPLPKTLDEAGPRILLYTHKPANPEAMSFSNILKVYFMTMDILMAEDDNCMVAGFMKIADFKGFPLHHLKQVTPTLLHKFALCSAGVYPIRNKGVHNLNVPGVFEKLYEIGKRFVSEKIAKRVFLYTEETATNVYKSIPKSVLPKEYGGDGDSINELGAAWKKKVESYREWFLEDAKYGSNEKLRTGKPKTSTATFGVEGSFRKLDID